MAKYKRENYFVVDTETGGLDSKNCSLLTLHGVIVNNDLESIVEPIDLKIKHEIYQITAGSLEINKINLVEHDKTALTIREAGGKLFKYLEPFVQDKRLGLIGQNLEFDKNFIIDSGLIRSWDRFFCREILDTKYIGTYLKHIGALPETTSVSLVELAKHFKIDTENAHNASHDVWMTLEVLKKFKQLKKEIL